MTTSMLLHNGIPASEAALARVAFAGFAHFTAMQVRDGAVRGYDLHLERLRSASDVMFGTHLSDDTVDAHLRQAVAGAGPEASVTAYIASIPAEFEAASDSPVLETFVRVGAPAAPPAGPLSLDVVSHQRHLPEVKHVGEVAKTLFLRRARAHGFDDAVFVDEARNVSEATIWNLAFWDGARVVWPAAAMLDGITQQIVRAQLALAGVAQASVPVSVDGIDPRWACALLNSWSPGIAVSRMGGTPLGDPTTLLDVLHRAFAAAPPTDLASPRRRLA